ASRGSPEPPPGRHNGVTKGDREPSMEDKEQLIASITATQRSLGRLFGAARANPLMSLNLTMRQLKVLLTLARRGPLAGHALTAEGRKLVGSVMDAGSAQYRRLLSRLEVEELRLLDSLIRRMAEIADEEFPDA